MPKQVYQRLNARKVETLPPGMYCDGGNLYLRVRPNSRTWIFRYLPPGGGYQRHMGLGPTKLLTLAKARDKAIDLRRQLIHDKIDPLEARRAERAEKARVREVEHPRIPIFTDLMKEALTELFKLKDATYRGKTMRSLEIHALPILGEKRMNTNMDHDVYEVLHPIWNTKRVAARKVRRNLELVFNFAIFKKYYPFDNPALWIKLKNALTSDAPEVKHRKALDNVTDIIPLMAELRSGAGVYYPAAEFTILTVARREMTRGLEWSEIDLTTAVWTIPKAKMKARRDFRIPLSTRALAIIEAMAALRRSSKYVFPGAQAAQMNGSWPQRIVKRVSGDPEMTIHGLARAGFRTWTQEIDRRFDRDIIEAALDHKIHNATEAAYARSDLLEERRKLMQAWDDYCSGA